VPTQQLRHVVKPEPEVIVIEVPVYIGKSFSTPVFRTPETWNDPSDYNPSYHGEVVPVDNIKSFSSSNIRATPGYSAINTVAPVVSGTVKIGQTLTTTNGTWAGGPGSYTYQWKRDGVDIVGATSSTYVVTGLDVGPLITCDVVAYVGLVASTPASSNSISSVWRNIIVAKPNVVIYDSKDPYCNNNTATLGAIVQINSIRGTVIGTQPTASSRGYVYYDGSIFLDGVDDFYILDTHASKFNSLNTYIVGFANPENTTTAVRTLLSAGQTDSGGSTKQLNFNFSRQGAVNSSRMRKLYADDSTLVQVTLTSKTTPPFNFVARTYNAPSYDFRVDDLLNPLVQIDVTQTRPVVASPAYTWATLGARRIGLSPTVSQYWQGYLKHFAFDNSTWTDGEVEIYRLCASAAGVL